VPQETWTKMGSIYRMNQTTNPNNPTRSVCNWVTLKVKLILKLVMLWIIL
jgi:hypothetical protein